MYEITSFIVKLSNDMTFRSLPAMQVLNAVVGSELIEILYAVWLHTG